MRTKNGRSSFTPPASPDTRHVIAARFLFASHAEAARAAESLDRLALPGLLAAELVIEEI